MHIGNYLKLLQQSEKTLVPSFSKVAEQHGDEPDITGNCNLSGKWSQGFVEALEPFVAKYKPEKNNEPRKLMCTLFDKTRKGSLGLLRDLHDLWLLANEAQLSCLLLKQAADGLQDQPLKLTCEQIEEKTKKQLAWLLSRMKQAAPQILIAAE